MKKSKRIFKTVKLIDNKTVTYIHDPLWDSTEATRTTKMIPPDLNKDKKNR